MLQSCLTNRIESEQFGDLLLSERPLIDLRAPCEFIEGSFPNAINLPLLTDDERASVGTVYKQEGSEAAIKLGHQIVSGEVRESRTNLWLKYVRSHPEAALLCFRGGLRSQTVQAWLAAQGCEVPLVTGGYKSLRRYLLRSIESVVQELPLVVISGMTGVGKSKFLQTFPRRLDLEKSANHLGSAFGGLSTPQPAQINFENEIAVQLLRLKQAPILATSNPSRTVVIEDESRMIGKLIVPEAMFKSLRASPVVLLECSIADRVEHILTTYVVRRVTSDPASIQDLLDRFTIAIRAISPKLGPDLTSECLSDLSAAVEESKKTGRNDLHKAWIEKLLNHYYDPIYRRSLKKRQPKILFAGSPLEASNYLAQYDPGRSVE